MIWANSGQKSFSFTEIKKFANLLFDLYACTWYNEKVFYSIERTTRDENI